MLMLIFSVLGSFGISESFYFPPPDVCVSAKESIECICKNRENLTISANLNYDIRSITVEGCGAVTVPYGAITDLQLESFTLTDLDQLEIAPFALIGIQAINWFKIENIRQFKVKPHGFVGMYNVSNLVIRNVSSHSLPFASFGGVSDINNFLIENSIIGEVVESAFTVTNVTNFTFANCKFQKFQNTSFLIHSGETIQFENCDIQETNNNSFTTSFVTSLSFINCHFGNLASTSILTKSLETFTFRACSVKVLETDAFASVDATEKFTFTHNSIDIAGLHSLVPCTETCFSNLGDIDYCCNSFTCDCNIFWLWDSTEGGEYDCLLENSYCIGKPETNLSSLTPILDSSRNCMTLKLKVLHSNGKYSSADETSAHSIADVTSTHSIADETSAHSIANENSAETKVFHFKLIFSVFLLGLSELIF